MVRSNQRHFWDIACQRGWITSEQCQQFHQHHRQNPVSPDQWARNQNILNSGQIESLLKFERSGYMWCQK